MKRPKRSEYQADWTYAEALKNYINSLEYYIEDLKDTVDGLRAFKRGVDEALNSGDGVYRP